MLLQRPYNRSILPPRRTSLRKGAKKIHNFKATEPENSFRDKPSGKTSKFLLVCLQGTIMPIYGSKVAETLGAKLVKQRFDNFQKRVSKFCYKN